MSTKDPYWEYPVALLRYEAKLSLYRLEIQQKYAFEGIVIPRELITALPENDPRFSQDANWWYKYVTRPSKSKEGDAKNNPHQRPLTHAEDLFYWGLCQTLRDQEIYRAEVQARFAPLGVHIPREEISAIPAKHERLKRSGLWLRDQRIETGNWLEEKTSQGMNESRLRALDQATPNILRDANDETLLWNLRVFRHQLPLYRVEEQAKYARFGVELDDDDITTIPTTHPLFGHGGKFHSHQRESLQNYLAEKKTTERTLEHLHQVFGGDLRDPAHLINHKDEEFFWNCRAYPIVWKKMRQRWPKALYLSAKSKDYEGMEIDASMLGNWVGDFLKYWRSYEKTPKNGTDRPTRETYRGNEAFRVRAEMMSSRIEVFKNVTGLESPYLINRVAERTRV